MNRFRRPTRAPVSLASAAIGAALLTCLGCGPPPTTVSGTVTLDGKPLHSAALMFYPTAGDGPTSHAFTDETGKFSAKALPKKTTVTVSLFRPSDTIRDGEPVAEQVVPARYVDRETTVLVIEPVAGKNTVCDFALTTKP